MPLDDFVREGAPVLTREPGNQPWTNVKPRGAVRADGFRPSPSMSFAPVRPGVWPVEEDEMTAARILDGLERSEATGAEADNVARMGFLEWAFGLEGEVTPAKAKAALDSAEAQGPESDAACAFVVFLRQATRPVSGGLRRGRRRALH